MLVTTCSVRTASTCGYRRQNKIHVNDPDGTHWEVYVVEEEIAPETIDRSLEGVAARIQPTTGPVVWEHYITHNPLDRIPHDDASVSTIHWSVLSTQILLTSSKSSGRRRPTSAQAGWKSACSWPDGGSPISPGSSATTSWTGGIGVAYSNSCDFNGGAATSWLRRPAYHAYRRETLVPSRRRRVAQIKIIGWQPMPATGMHEFFTRVR